MERKPFDLPYYMLDRFRYRGLDKRMFWFQKFRGRQWLYGQNFGDYLSLVIVGEFLKRSGIFPIPVESGNNRLLALGSVMHFGETGDVVWGTGVNGKVPMEKYKFDNLDVRMVRGPLTREFLMQRGTSVPDDVYGDPALLLPKLFPKFKWKPISGRVSVLPNFNEFEQVSKLVPDNFHLISPIGYWKGIVKDILHSELVLTSSLHGLIISEVFGIPVRFVAPFGGETLFKYEDYLLGTGRSLEKRPKSFLEGIHTSMGVGFAAPKVDMELMIERFPLDFFQQKDVLA